MEDYLVQDFTALELSVLQFALEDAILDLEEKWDTVSTQIDKAAYEQILSVSKGVLAKIKNFKEEGKVQ